MKIAEQPISMADMTANAQEAAALMRALSNAPRLLIMCHLAAAGELPVGSLVERIELSQSALSQHLAKLRDQGLVAYRRDAQSLHYRIADSRAVRVLELLHEIYCPALEVMHD
jgi:DNA-binding transcriptional ArsR family regulator